MRRVSLGLSLLVVVATVCLPLGLGCRKAGSLPKNVSGWQLAQAPVDYDARTIFDYMDGYAEAYLVYAFSGLKVARYQRGDAELVVEIYDMTNGPEAFGVFSNHLDGDPHQVGQDCRVLDTALSFWQGRYFCKVFELRRRSGFREDMLAIAQAVAPELGPSGDKPAMLKWLPQGEIACVNVRYFHDEGNLNSLQYISTENVLHLDPKTTDCVFADVRWADRPEQPDRMPRLLIIRYPLEELRDQAWRDLGRKVLHLADADLNGTQTPVKDDNTPVACRTRIDGAPLLMLCFPATRSDPLFAALVEWAAGAR